MTDETGAARGDDLSRWAGPWDRFWFSPADSNGIATVRELLTLITLAYFASCWADIDRWYVGSAPVSSDNVASFLRTAGLQDEGKWILSPLFLVDQLAVYRIYLVTGIVVSALVLFGRAGRIGGFLLWGLLVGWANRSMFLSSLAETLLSMGLFAAAIATPTSMTRWLGRDVDSPSQRPLHWTNRFSQRLMAVQLTVMGMATFATMLSGRVWWNGLGAYALAAPVEDRTIDWSGSILASAVIHDTVTFLLVAALPVGFFLSWRGRSRNVGMAVLIAWCLGVALLGSHWLYAATFAAMALTLGDKRLPNATT